MHSCQLRVADSVRLVQVLLPSASGLLAELHAVVSFGSELALDSLCWSVERFPNRLDPGRNETSLTLRQIYLGYKYIMTRANSCTNIVMVAG